jgi:hypothetical protein
VDTRTPESLPSDPRADARTDARSDSGADSRTDSGPAVLAELIAAGLVSHEMIGDPARLGGEAEALRLLCGLVAGPVWRIEPWHYAFRADPGGAAPARAAELEAALAAELGEGAVWVSATERPEATELDQPLMLLRAHAEAVLEAAGPELVAVIGARFAAAAAGIAAGVAGGGLADRLTAIEARQAAILAALEAERAGAEALGRLGAALGQVLQRLDAQADVLHAHIAREDMVAGRLAELAAMAGTPAAFAESLGLTLAEFLARIENREALLPARATQAG